MSNWKVMIVHFIVGLIEKTESNDCIKMSQYEPYEPFGGDISIKVDLSIYATKQIWNIYRMLVLQVLY